MARRTDSAIRANQYIRAERKLTELVVVVEFTMVSVVTGLMLIPPYRNRHALGTRTAS